MNNAQRTEVQAHFALATLSASERTVLALIAKRLTTAEVMQAIPTTRDGVYQHVHRLCSKLGVKSREEAIQLYKTFQIKPQKRRRNKR